MTLDEQITRIWCLEICVVCAVCLAAQFSPLVLPAEMPWGRFAFAISLANLQWHWLRGVHAMTNAIQLRKPDGSPAAVYMCGVCGAWAHGSRASADECCEPSHCACGVAVVRPQAKCMKCQRETASEREAKRYAAAKKVSVADYDGHMVDIGDEIVFVDHLDEYLAEHFEAWQAERPAVPYEPPRIYGTKPTQHLINVDDAIESALDEAYEDAHEHVDADALRELEAYVLAWSRKHMPTTYYSDYSVVLLPFTTALED